MDFSSSGLGLTLAQDERANWSPLLGALRRKGLDKPFEGTLDELFAQNLMPRPSIQDSMGNRPGLGQ